MDNCAADVIFVIDSSACVGFLNWYMIKQFVMDIVQGLNVAEGQTRIGVVSFSTMVRTDVFLGEYYDPEPDMLQAIWDIPYMADSTNTADGILSMHDMFLARRRSHVQQIAILLTDGPANIMRENTISNAEAAVTDDIAIFVIGEWQFALDIDMLQSLC